MRHTEKSAVAIFPQEFTKYLKCFDVLQNNINPALVAQYPNQRNPLILDESIIEYHDNGKPHYTAAVRNYLSEVFPVVGRIHEGPECPA